MITKEKARLLRRLIEQAVASLDDEDALDCVMLYHQWEPDTAYSVGDRVQYGEKLYKAVQAHTSQWTWLPSTTPALWTEVAPPGVIPEWRQPTGAQDAYMNGDKVTHNGTTWICTIDNNVWEPGVYGWEVYSE